MASRLLLTNLLIESPEEHVDSIVNVLAENLQDDFIQSTLSGYIDVILRRKALGADGLKLTKKAIADPSIDSQTKVDALKATLTSLSFNDLFSAGEQIFNSQFIDDYYFETTDIDLYNTIDSSITDPKERFHDFFLEMHLLESPSHADDLPIEDKIQEAQRLANSFHSPELKNHYLNKIEAELINTP